MWRNNIKIKVVLVTFVLNLSVLTHSYGTELGSSNNVTVGEKNINFSDVDNLSASILDSVVTGSTTYISYDKSVRTENIIRGSVFANSSGVNSIIQNSGANSNVSQSIAVNYRAILNSLGLQDRIQ